ncbi:MAG: methionine gamma-lyase family protein, partial [Prochlorothrix sp.]
MYISEQIHQAENALRPIFSGIDAQVKKNLERLLTVFRQHRLGTHHFS